MGFIDNYGKAAGPIQIGSSGPWLITNKITAMEQEFPVKYLTVSNNATLNISNLDSFTNANDLVTLRSRTPLLGTYKTTSGNMPYADLNAVATVKWVMAYASLDPGDRAIDLDSYVDYTAFNSALVRITTLENASAELEYDLDALTDQFNSFVAHADDEFVSHVRDGFDTWKTTVNNYMAEPFPSGLLLQCGSATTVI